MEISTVALLSGILYPSVMDLRSLARNHTTARALAGRPMPLLGRLLRAEDPPVDPMAAPPEAAAPDAPPAPAADDRPRFALSTEGEASDGNIVMQHWDLSRAAAAGVPVLWTHDQEQLLGQWQDLQVEQIDGKPTLTGRALLDPEDEDAQKRAGQIKRGFLNAVSVGWIPGAMVRRGDLPPEHMHYREPMEGDCGQAGEGYVMGTPERPNILVEASLVACPADQDAVALERLHARGGGVAVRALSGQPVTERDLDTLLATLASHPRVRGWLDAQIDRAVQRRTAPPVAPPPPPSPPPAERRLSDLFPSGSMK